MAQIENITATEFKKIVEKRGTKKVASTTSTKKTQEK